MHSMMLTSLLSAPMSFFDVTPTGRILNRFLQDMQNVDNCVPSVIIQQIQNTLNMSTQFILIFVYCWMVFFLLPFLVVPYTVIFKKIRSPARDTRRIESIAHSPVYAEYVDCLKGIDTIRAMEKESAFVQSNLDKVTQMAKGRYWSEAVQKWAQALTTLLGCGLYAVGGLTGCWFFYKQSNMISSADFGLVLMYLRGDFATVADGLLHGSEKSGAKLRQCGAVRRIHEIAA